MPTNLYRRPWVGLLGLVVGFLTQPLGHTVFMLNALALGTASTWSAAALGVLGFAVVWSGLSKDELKASWLGMLGGWMVWTGWFEQSFKFFSELFQVPAFIVEPGVRGGYVATPHANMLQATVSIMLALFILYGLFNRETRCNLMRWLHRRLHLNPGLPTPDDKRSFARITAMEVLFVTWFCYLFWLYAIYFGTRGSGLVVVMGLYCAWTAWALYLVYRCTLQPRAAAALRYGIGAGIVLWGSVEMPAHFGAYREYWLHPDEYPLFNAAEILLFAATLALMARARLATAAGPAAPSLAPY